MFSHRLPHAVAQACENGTPPYGSSVLATTIDGKGSGSIGTASKPAASAGNPGPAGSGTATSSAPATFESASCEAWRAAQNATVRQPRLCATSRTGAFAAATAASSVSHHSPQTG